MIKKLSTLVVMALLLTACKQPQHENRGVNNNIQSISLSTDSSMVNPMNPVTSSGLTLTLSSDLTLSSGVKITQAQFNNVIKGIKFIDISKLKEIEHPPTMGSSYKSVSIKTDKKTYHFSEDSYKDYPSVIAQLVANIYKLNSSPAQSSDDKWHKLKMIKEYEGVEFNLKEGVEYLEIRLYTKGQKAEKYSKKYQVAVRMQRTPLEFFDAKLVKEFKNIEPNFSVETNIKKTGFCLMAGCTHILGNGMMIDSKKKMWSMNTTEDILEMIGEVDTPTEAKLIVWLNSKHMGESKEDSYTYRKVSNGYEVRHEFENSIANFGECGHFVYDMFVGSNGEISKKKLVKKTESESGCLEMD